MLLGLIRLTTFVLNIFQNDRVRSQLMLYLRRPDALSRYCRQQLLFVVIHSNATNSTVALMRAATLAHLVLVYISILKLILTKIIVLHKTDRQ